MSDLKERITRRLSAEGALSERDIEDLAADIAALCEAWHPYPEERPENEGWYTVALPDKKMDKWYWDKSLPWLVVIAWRECPTYPTHMLPKEASDE